MLRGGNIIGYIAATTVTSKAARKAQSMSAGRISLRLGGVERVVGSVKLRGIRSDEEPLRRGVCSFAGESSFAMMPTSS